MEAIIYHHRLHIVSFHTRHPPPPRPPTVLLIPASTSPPPRIWHDLQSLSFHDHRLPILTEQPPIISLNFLHDTRSRWSSCYCERKMKVWIRCKGGRYHSTCWGWR